MLNGTGMVAMKNAKDWARALPLANPFDAARALTTQLEAWNHQQAAAKQRYAALEALGEPVAQVLDTLERGLRDVSFPLRGKQRLAAEQLDTLLALLIEGYESVVAQSDPPDDGLLSTRFATLWSQAAQRVFYYAAPLVGERKRLAMRCDDGLWMRLHGLYRLVRQSRIERLEMLLPRHELGKRGIETLYKEILLLSLIPLQELRREQRREIEETLPVWAGLVKIRDCTSIDYQGTGDFVVDYYQDQGPLPFTGEEDEGAREQWLLLDVQRLVSRLDRYSREVEQEGRRRVTLDAEHKVSPRTLGALLRACKPILNREEVRTPLRERLDAFFTFSGVHYHLAAGEDATAQASELAGQGDPPAHFTSSTLVHWDTFRPETLLVDISERGMRIEFDTRGDLAVRVGDVVGVSREGENLLRIGHIRWLEMLAGGRMAAGLYLWCCNPQRASLAVRSSDGAKALLPALIGEHERSGKTLLVLSYLPGIHKKQLNLVMHSKRLPIKLRLRPSEHSQAFTAYEFGIPTGWENGRQKQVNDLSIRALELLLKKSRQ